MEREILAEQLQLHKENAKNNKTNSWNFLADYELAFLNKWNACWETERKKGYELLFLENKRHKHSNYKQC